MLRQQDVASFLVEHGLITEEQIVDGSLRIINASRRNCNFKVINDQGPCYFIKQGLGPENGRTVAHEADVYRLLQQLPAGARLIGSPYRFSSSTNEEAILVLELSRDSQSLLDFHTVRRRFSRRVAAALGRALGMLHSL